MENFDMEDARLTNRAARQANGNYGKIVTTPEAIVREHRERWAKRESRIDFQTRTDPTPTTRQIDRRLMILNTRWKILKFFRSINWDVAIEWLCWGLVIITFAGVIGIVVFGPTSWREFWK